MLFVERADAKISTLTFFTYMRPTVTRAVSLSVMMTLTGFDIYHNRTVGAQIIENTVF